MPVLSQPLGMVSYWKFDEGSESAVFDSVDAHDGTIYGATWTTGIAGDALAFDGVDDYVDFGNVLSVGASPLTIVLWFKNTVGATDWPLLIAGTDPVPGQNDLQLQALPDMLRVQSDEMPWYIGWPIDGGAFTVHVNTFDGQWHFVALIRDTAALKYALYWDGNFLAEKGFTQPLYNFAFTIWEVGRFTEKPVEAFGGLIDEVAIYNRVLTADEIQQHYENGLNGLGYFSDPKASTQQLIETIKIWNLPKGTENSLTSKLQNAIQSLDNGQQNAAINKLNAFINEVQAQRNKKLTNEQANTLISEAQRIINTTQG
jgi:hypothetical protein